ncbi:ABC transporter ATP-binding protein [Pollutimonas bauzanensis]|uniref:Peptide/nickel transport system ATP-binding protein n=1 Tax=Pollutimonas bauzanensis TaxID=658167 RepID=A0A1M5M4L7_9BURK|nr:ABC transporter ATP-binding protein [Pollutimonas bauzanensis]SHG72198.1 peptide/nickel transport system ATP-binding protein [Pollutimonas bauzanensis]
MTVSYPDNGPRIAVQSLSTSFLTDRGRVQSVSDVSFSIPAGSTLALVGESGSGKSVTSLSLMGLHARTSHPRVDGKAMFLRRNGERVSLLDLPARQLRSLRGNEMAMIFQEPMTSLNPLLTVGEQIAEATRLHLGHDRKQAMAHARRMLDLVEIPDAARRVQAYPHELSGGMRQRVMIALAMACTPTLLIADEPTTALDVTIQAQILALIGRLQKESGMSVLFITHNLGVVAQYASDVAVMYAGRIVETGDVRRVFASPAHPYTRALLNCLPAMAKKANVRDAYGRLRLAAIEGQVSSPFNMPPGCAFSPRCPLADGQCDASAPGLSRLADGGGQVRCFKAHGVLP